MTTIALPSTRRHSFLEMSQPDPEDRPHDDAPAAPAAVVIDDTIHAWLVDRRNAGESNNTLASKLGYRSGSTVSRYIGRKPEGNVAEFESRCRDLMARVADARPQISSDRFATSVTRQFAAFADSIYATGLRGVVTGDAGLGKSCAAEDYASRRETSVMLVLDMANRDDLGIRRLLWSTFEHRGSAWRSENRWAQIIAHYKGSGRLLIIDQAQRLNMSGLFALHDFADKTGCPMLLIGNPSLLDLVGADAQVFRRTFQAANLTLKDSVTVARRLVEIHAPDHTSPDVFALAARSITRDGHLGLVVNTLLAANEYVKLPALQGDYCDAYRAAHTKSVHGSIPL